MSDDEQPEQPNQEPEQPAADGLDLARAAARAAAAAGGPVARRRGRGTRRSGPEDDTRASRSSRRPSGFSGARPDDRDPQELQGEMDRLIARRGWEVDLRVHGVIGRWRAIVGDEIADHCVPESFTDGRLIVRTSSTAWATQLRLLAPSLVRRLNEEVGHGTVSRVEVVGPQAPSWKKGRRSVQGRGPRDTYG